MLRPIITSLCGSILLLFQCSAPAAVTLNPGNSAGKLDEIIGVTVELASDIPVTALQFDLVSAGNLLAQSALPGPAAGTHTFLSSSPGPGSRRLLIYSTATAPLANGALATIHFQGTNVGVFTLSLDNVILSTPDGQKISPVSQGAGSLNISLPTPVLGPVSLTADGRIRFRLRKVANARFTIEASEQLSSWSPLFQGRGDGSDFDFTDPTPPVPMRFYRAILSPP
jgi:hypothetical protein